MSIHIYRVDGQPLTKWRLGLNIMDPPSPWFECSPRKLEHCHNCYRLRRAGNLTIYVYYDHSRVVCAEGCAPSTYKERYARLRKIRRAQKSEACANE